MLAKSFEMVGRAVAFVAGEAVLWINGVPLLHAPVAMRFRKDGGCGDGDAAGIALNQGFLLDQDVELHGVNEQIIGQNCELLERSRHRLARGLVNVPGIDALGVHFGDGPGKSVFADARRELCSPFGSELFRVVQSDNAPLGIENHRGGNDRTKQRAASGFVNAGDARPAEFARRSLETGGAESAHYARDFSTPRDRKEQQTETKVSFALYS